MTATAVAGKVCSRCEREPAVKRDLCAGCYETVNPTTAVQERLLDLLDYIAARRGVQEGERHALRVEFDIREGHASDFELTFVGPGGTPVLSRAPVAAVQERVLALLHYMAERGVVQEGERFVLRIELEARAGRCSGYGLTLTGAGGRLAYRQGFGR